MCSLSIRSPSVFAALLSATALGSGATWALPDAQAVESSSLELGAGYAAFPQGGLGLVRAALTAPLGDRVSGSLIAHSWHAPGLPHQRFAIGGLSYRRALNPSFALAPFIQSVLFDGGGALDRRLTARWSGDRGSPHGAGRVTCRSPIGLKSFVSHPVDRSLTLLGAFDLLLATEAGISWTGWRDQTLRLGLAGTLIRIHHQAMIFGQQITSQVATAMGSGFWADRLAHRLVAFQQDYHRTGIQITKNTKLYACRYLRDDRFVHIPT